MLRNIIETVGNYYTASAYLAREPGRNRLSTLVKALQYRARHGMSIDDLAFYSLDGKWLERPSEYIHGKDRPYDFMRKNMIRKGAWHAVDNKLAFHLRCKRSGIPTPEMIVAVPARGADPSMVVDSLPLAWSAEEFQRCLDASLLNEFFCKPLNGQNGNGGFAFKRTATGFSRNDKPLSAYELFEEVLVIADRYRTMVVEERLRLHPVMQRISPSGALSTIRMVTALEEGAVRPVASLLKICAGSNETDNFHKGMTGNLIANIDLETGRLGKAISSASSEFPLMRTYAHHPDSQQLIEGFQLPDWPELLNLVKAAHREFSELWTLGWDVALTDRGPVIVEGNSVWAVEFIQLASGKGLRHEFDRWKDQIAQGRAPVSAP
jgi:hypothetical protein